MYCSKCGKKNLRCAETGIAVASRYDNKPNAADAFVCKDCGEVTITGASMDLVELLKTKI